MAPTEMSRLVSAINENNDKVLMFNSSYCNVLLRIPCQIMCSYHYDASIVACPPRVAGSIIPSLTNIYTAKQKQFDMESYCKLKPQARPGAMCVIHDYLVFLTPNDDLTLKRRTPKSFLLSRHLCATGMTGHRSCRNRNESNIWRHQIGLLTTKYSQ